jgi:hypothetical protein
MRKKEKKRNMKTKSKKKKPAKTLIHPSHQFSDISPQIIINPSELPSAIPTQCFATTGGAGVARLLTYYPHLTFH